MRASHKNLTSVKPMIGGWLLMCSACWFEAVPANEAVTVQITPRQTTFFADEDVSFQLNVSAAQAIDGVVNWQLTALHRTLARGEVAAKINPGKSSPLSFRLPMPHIKDGVIQQTLLTASLKETPRAEPVVILQRDLWVFSANPFVDRQEWLEQLDLHLYDPVGETAKIFDAAGIPYEKIRSITGFPATESIVIVGEGVSLRKNSLLAQALLSQAAKGGRVLCFAPEDGDFEFPGGKDFAEKRPKNILFSGSDMIEQLDKRLDANLWTDAANANSIGLQLVSRRSRTYLEIGEPDNGWSWLRLDYNDPDGTLILCGLGLVHCWDASPTPRFMLARLLEQLASLDPSTEPATE